MFKNTAFWLYNDLIFMYNTADTNWLARLFIRLDIWVDWENNWIQLCTLSKLLYTFLLVQLALHLSSGNLCNWFFPFWSAYEMNQMMDLGCYYEILDICFKMLEYWSSGVVYVINSFCCHWNSQFTVLTIVCRLVLR